MKLESIYDRGIKFHHYCNTAYPLRPNSLAQYEVHDNTLPFVSVNVTIVLLKLE